MNAMDATLPAAAELGGRAIFMEAPAGPARAEALEGWLAQARRDGFRTWHLDGAMDEQGAWAGLADLLASLLPAMRERAPELVDKHSYELCLVMPGLRREIGLRHASLTDVANDEEKVRNYANDRAYRGLHGLIDLIAEWAELADGPAWAIACDAFDEASTLVHRFYAELLRRRGRRLGLALLLAVGPGQTATARNLFRPEVVAAETSIALPAASRKVPSPSACGRLAARIEPHAGDDRIEWSLHAARLVYLWQHSDTPERALRWMVRAVNVFDHDGLYEISFRYATQVEASLGQIFELDRRLHTVAVLNLFFCYAALGHAERALHVLGTDGLHKVADKAALVEINYFLAMLYARFLPHRDLELATDHLDRALALIPELAVSDERRYFLTVFMHNGLAYVRHRQGRPEEALQLCLSGFDELQQRLSPDAHRLHRSVLLYNAAQVLNALERHDETIDYLSRAMALDPNYPEYYAERGGLLLKLERPAEAERDLLRAIELSPPYTDVWTNLGQCYRATGRLPEAIRAYSTALDLDPAIPLALIGRADAAADSGDVDGAIRDYSAALVLEPDQPLVLAGRAVAYYQAGRVADAVHDLDQAIEAAPELAELYQNRAVALIDLGRIPEAEHDLQLYLALRPEADDRTDVERQLAELRSRTPLESATRAAA
jgi:tetratricopeptide (TPR) repeat protein